jgi:hypothetical protein
MVGTAVMRPLNVAAKTRPRNTVSRRTMACSISCSRWAIAALSDGMLETHSREADRAVGITFAWRQYSRQESPSFFQTFVNRRRTTWPATSPALGASVRGTTVSSPMITPKSPSMRMGLDRDRSTCMGPIAAVDRDHIPFAAVDRCEAVESINGRERPRASAPAHARMAGGTPAEIRTAA